MLSFVVKREQNNIQYFILIKKEEIEIEIEEEKKQPDVFVIDWLSRSSLNIGVMVIIKNWKEDKDDISRSRIYKKIYIYIFYYSLIYIKCNDVIVTIVVYSCCFFIL